MDALLILGGLLLFISAFIWLVMRAFDSSLLWGWGCLIPPITLLYIVRKWSRARAPVFLSGLAAGTVIVGLVQMTAKHPDRVSAIFSLSWMQPQPASTELQIQLDGKLNGQKFEPQTAELIDGVLTLREGRDFYARRELIIRLPQQPTGALRLDVLPQDKQQVPVVEMSWLLPEQDLPEARLLARGYSLRLDLVPVAPNKLAGDFHLVLPARFNTSLSGKLELYTDRLRYRNGQLDARYDSRETLAKVIEDYLQRRFSTSRVELGPLPVISFPTKQLDISVSSVVKGVSRQLPLKLEKDEQAGWRISSDRYPPLPPSELRPEPAQVEQPAVQVAARSTADRRTDFTLGRLQLNPNRYLNLMMRVETAGGITAAGRFSGISTEGALLIRSSVDSVGEATFSLPPDEVVSIDLLEP